jgi:hypothetical protein
LSNIIKFFIILLFTSGTAFAEIHEISDFNIILREVYRSNKDTWVIFDVDDVLVMRKDQILNSNHNKELAKISGTVSTRITEADMKNLWSIVHLSSKSEIVEQLIAEEIAGIHNHVDHVIAFTNMGTGKLGKIESVEDWRLNELQNFGIVFNTSLPTTSEKQLDCLLKKANPVCSPRFKDGVLFGCYSDKGEVLQAYLKHINIKPKKIIFIDDHRKNVESVQAFCKNENIEFVGFEYQAVKEKDVGKFNYKRAQLQFEILEKTHVWLCDDMAESILNNLK